MIIIILLMTLLLLFEKPRVIVILKMALINAFNILFRKEGTPLEYS